MTATPVTAWDRDALLGPVAAVAPTLLGAVLSGRGVVARVVEVEAYAEDDPASHSARGPTAANASMFGSPGRLYVYLSHGLHHCVNVSVGPVGRGDAVLVRAVEVLDGRRTAVARRGGRGERDPRLLAGGPGRVGQVLGATRADDGASLLGGGPLTLGHGPGPGTDEVRSGPRVGVRLGADRPWRWWLAAVPAVSTYRRHPDAPPTRQPRGTDDG